MAARRPSSSGGGGRRRCGCGGGQQQQQQRACLTFWESRRSVRTAGRRDYRWRINSDRRSTVKTRLMRRLEIEGALAHNNGGDPGVRSKQAATGPWRRRSGSDEGSGGEERESVGRRLLRYDERCRPFFFFAIGILHGDWGPHELLYNGRLTHVGHAQPQRLCGHSPSHPARWAARAGSQHTRVVLAREAERALAVGSPPVVLLFEYFLCSSSTVTGRL